MSEYSLLEQQLAIIPSLVTSSTPSSHQSTKLVDLQYRLAKISKQANKYLESLIRSTTGRAKEDVLFKKGSVEPTDLEDEILQRQITATTALALNLIDNALVNDAPDKSAQPSNSRLDQVYVNAFTQAFGDDLDSMRKGNAGAFDEEKLKLLLNSIKQSGRALLGSEDDESSPKEPQALFIKELEK